MTLADFIARLEGVRKSGDGYTAHCPAHDDNRSSLKISAGDNGGIVVHCHAGCTTIEVVSALQLDMADLMPEQQDRAKSQRRGQIVATYDYQDAAGGLLFQVVRMAPKDFRQRRPSQSASGWTWKLDGVRQVPYRLPQLLAAPPDEPVFVVEGEKDVDALRALGMVATCNAGGAGKWRKVHAAALKGRHVIAIPDNDAPGHKHAMAVARTLKGVAASVRVLELPELPPKGDVSDWLARGGTAEQLRELCKAAKEPIVGKGRPQEFASEMLMRLAQAETELFIDQTQTAHGRIQVNGHFATLPLHSRYFQAWLRWRYADAHEGEQVKTNAVNEVVESLAAAAWCRAEDRQPNTVKRTYRRVGEHEGKIYLDLCDDAWRAIEIDGAGWRVVSDPPVRFVRAPDMRPLPLPVQGGSVDALRRFVNVTDEQWPLLLAWLYACFWPDGPYPVLALYGERGAAKSTASRVLRRMIDPFTADICAPPRDERDLIVAARNAHLLAFDNLSHCPDWLSDAFCRLSTGGGFATRALYEDLTQVVYGGQAPILLNGITEVITRDDLLDRAIVIALPPIEADRRYPERLFWRDFELAQPTILGALLTALSEGLQQLPQTHLEQLPRLADFALRVVAAQSALGLRPDTFVPLYEGNRSASIQTTLDASPVSESLLTMIGASLSGDWSGTASELLVELERRISDRAIKHRSWPGNARGLGVALRRLVPALRQVGVDVAFHPPRSTGKRLITISKTQNHE